MKKIFLIFLLIIAGVIYYKYSHFVLRTLRDDSNNHNKETKKIIITPTKKFDNEVIEITNKSIFVPYWEVNGIGTNYDKYIYFGITVNSQGIDKLETGYLKLDQFTKVMEDKDTYLTLRLLDNDFNHEILKDSELQQKIIEQTLETVKENNFKGVVLDLELFSLFNEEISVQINDFVQKFYTAAKANYKSFTIAIYGDVFYRKRPYDISFLSKHSDEILIMAYDFSKSIGEPGPNFPLARQSDSDGGPKLQKYSYDFKTMVKDFARVVPKEKLTVIFGMYGYDWQVDEKKRPITTAKALTLKKIKKEFLENCQWQDCVVKRDALSKETEVNYVNSTIKDNISYLDYHIVWFEDEESVKVKSQYLQKQGISSIGYWAWGYF